MPNNYHAAEIVQIGDVQEVIRGLPKPGDRFDSLIQENNIVLIIFDDAQELGLD